MTKYIVLAKVEMHDSKGIVWDTPLVTLMVNEIDDLSIKHACQKKFNNVRIIGTTVFKITPEREFKECDITIKPVGMRFPI